MKPEIVLQSSAWYIVLCVCLGIAFSGFLYFKKEISNKFAHWALAISRAIFTALLAFLLLNPLIKTIKNIILKPKVVFAIDNSKSMSFAGKNNVDKLVDRIKQLKAKLEAKGFEVDTKSLDSEDIKQENVNSSTFFNATKSNLSEMLSTIKSNYEGQNLSDVVLISDGIINDGVSPNYQKYNFNIHTVAFGDSTSKRDLVLNGITANKLAYLGNNYSLSVDVNAYKFKGASSVVLIKNGAGKVLAQKTFTAKNEDDFQTISFELMAEKVGKNRLEIEIKPLNGEFSTANNHREIVIEVVNGKEKILLVAFAPHPDVKALKSIIEKNNLFELTIQNIQSTDASLIGKEPFDILILHQLPDQNNVAAEIVNGLIAKKKPTFFILGAKSNFQTFNGMQSVFSLSNTSNQMDKALAKFNPKFNLFGIDAVQYAKFLNFPPLLVPFGQYTLGPGTEVLLHQKIGNIITERPLLGLNLNGNIKNAVLAGEGIWQWRMEEFETLNSNVLVDDLITKVLQLISVKENKSKLRVYPIAETFDINQKVIFEGEIYNDAFEKIYGQKISLKIKSDKNIQKNYEFTLSEEASRFELSNLPAGLYTYSANAQVLGKSENCSGEFLITKTDLEYLNTVADYALMKNLANENHGLNVGVNNMLEIANKLEKKGAIDKIISNEEFKEFINWRYLLYIIMAFASLEWIFRKYLGMD